MTIPFARLTLLCAVLATACDAPPATSPPTPTPPPGPYPQAATVDVDALASILPKDADGKPVLLEVGGVALTLGAERKDAIGAHASCIDLFTRCVVKTKDSDRCAADVPRCATSEPWNESAACCPSACVAAYQEERRLGATNIEADLAVFGSTHECFPGLVEQYSAAGGTPRRLPRRAR
jgi:hypothetical protein